MICAIVGATGNVGRKIVELMLDRLDSSSLRLFASAQSAGKMLEIKGHLLAVEDVASYDFRGCSVALFATESDVSRLYVPRALAAGARVVDSSSAYRLDPAVPLIIPPVNLDLVTDQHDLYAHANCVACPIATVLSPLHQAVPAKRVVVSTYQSTSGAGKGPMGTLFIETKNRVMMHENLSCDGKDHFAQGGQDSQVKFKFSGEKIRSPNAQAKQKLEPQEYVRKYFPRPIAFNIIPQVDKILDDGYSYEEVKIIKEVQKVISSEIAITATAVRVPVMIGHSISMWVEFEGPLSVAKAREILSTCRSVCLSENNYTTPVEVEGKDDVFVGRLRQDTPYGLHLWLCSDNLRRGAALDAVEIGEKLLRYSRPFII